MFIMIQESEIRDLIEETIEGTDIFLVELKISGGNKISVLVDAIGGLPITDCMKVSRGIDHNLDREDEDFELNVSSPGLDKPFKVFKQYEKNRGRSIHVTLEDEGVFDAK
ncbi:MAG: ribosome maturation factor RimP, partial [Salibacteraceae bacterium]